MGSGHSHFKISVEQQFPNRVYISVQEWAGVN